MTPEIVRVETLESMIALLAAHKAHEAARRAVRFDHQRDETFQEETLARSCARPTVFADSNRRRVQVELSYFEPDGEDARRARKVLVWNASDQVPDEVEALRQLAGKRVLCSAMVEGLRPFMPAEQHAELVDLVAVCKGRLEATLDGDVASLSWIGGCPEMKTLEWSADYGDRDGDFGSLTVSLSPEVHINETGVALLATFRLDLDDNGTKPDAFREYVRSFDWDPVDAVTVFGEAPAPAGLARADSKQPVVMPSLFELPDARMAEFTFELPDNQHGRMVARNLLRNLRSGHVAEVSIAGPVRRMLPGS